MNKHFNEINASDLNSRLASALLANNRSTAEGYEDIRIFGAPSECGKLVADYGDRKQQEILDSFGLTAAQANARLETVCDAKFLYENGLLLDDGIDTEWGMYSN